MRKWPPPLWWRHLMPGLHHYGNYTHHCTYQHFLLQNICVLMNARLKRIWQPVLRPDWSQISRRTQAIAPWVICHQPCLKIMGTDQRWAGKLFSRGGQGVDRVPVSVSEWLLGSFVLILSVFVQLDQYSQILRRQCCLGSASASKALGWGSVEWVRRTS